jgi:hypothetical protein
VLESARIGQLTTLSKRLVLRHLQYMTMLTPGSC